jgi:leucyl/phenylalanyl-tRNA--protein transferase
MPVFRLGPQLVFPDPRLAEPDGLLAIGGDLQPARVLLAYRMGIFPWFSEGEPILWWCPRPRFVLEPTAVHVPKSLRKAARLEPYRITADTSFAEVVRSCARTPRPGQRGTWITAGMRESYQALHEQGFAHSLEAWQDDELVGGLYGIAIGGVFCGESMFATRPNASKLAFLTLIEHLRRWDFTLVDCQVPTDHLARFGAHAIPLEEFLGRLEFGLTLPGRPGKWALET